jgi:hypothetical protein
MTVRRETVRITLAILVVAAAVPFAIIDTIETDRVYLFSREFLEELPQRFTGAGRLRFILQPMTASFLGIRGGLADAKTKNPSYLFMLLFHAGRRKELLRSRATALSSLLAIGVVMDIVFQLVLYRAVHPAVALLVGPIFICFPYAFSRTLTARLARG